MIISCFFSRFIVIVVERSSSKEKRLVYYVVVCEERRYHDAGSSFIFMEWRVATCQREGNRDPSRSLVAAAAGGGREKTAELL